MSLQEFIAAKSSSKKPQGKRLRIVLRNLFARMTECFREPKAQRIEKILANQPGPSAIPNCVGFIMDGNGRHAQKRGKDHLWGHTQGLLTARKIVDATFSRGVRVVGVWGASDANFEKRDAEEMGHLLKLFKDEIKDRLEKNDIGKLHVCGDTWQKYNTDPQLPGLVHELEAKSAPFAYKELNVFFGYGGRPDCRHMVRGMISDFVRQGVSLDKLDEFVTDEAIHAHLLSSYVPNVDLLIRTGEAPGSAHLSRNFLFWQTGDSECAFTETLWPEFSVAELDRILDGYALRRRLKGGRDSSG